MVPFACFQKSNTSAHCALVLELPRKTQCSQALVGTAFNSHSKEAEQDQLQEWHWSPMASRSLLQLAQGIGLHTPLLCCRMKDLVSAARGTHRAAGLARCHMTHALKQNKGMHVECDTGKDSPTQGNGPSTHCEDSLSFGKGVFQAQGPFLCSKVGIKRLCVQDWLS